MEALCNEMKNMIPEQLQAWLQVPIRDRNLGSSARSAPRKSPGVDGIPVDFCSGYGVITEDLVSMYNQMFTDGLNTKGQKLGSLVCIPKDMAKLVRLSLHHFTQHCL